MEKRQPSGAIDNPEVIFPSDNSPTTDIKDEIGNTSRNSLESEEKRPALAQRLAEAFREGVASTKSDYDKRPEVRIPPPAKKNRQEPSDAGVLDRVIREGGSAVAVVGDKAASALDSVVQLAKKAPAMTHKYAEAFREGAASVKLRESREQRDDLPPVAGKKIRMYKKNINNLYIEIGREAVNSWGKGPVETEKVAELLDELRKNEEEIQNLREWQR